VAGYPDGHPLLDASELRRQMLAKQELFAAAGVTGSVATQMCFDPPRIRSWLAAERAAGLTLPVRLGVPGVVDRGRLIRMGTRLGVGASLRFASKQGGAIARLIAPGGYDPLHVVGALAPDAERLGIEGLHVFTFNSVAETVAWRDALLR
jgi:methylenetetrahydrofolate reductase (NADPH)